MNFIDKYLQSLNGEEPEDQEELAENIILDDEVIAKAIAKITEETTREAARTAMINLCDDMSDVALKVNERLRGKFHKREIASIINKIIEMLLG